MKMKPEEYLRDPCTASSLPFWKAESWDIPDSIEVFRDGEKDLLSVPGTDEPYFKLMRYTDQPVRYRLPEGFQVTGISPEELAAHILECYRNERATLEELLGYMDRKVYDRALWLAVRETSTGRIAASGTAEVDSRIGEGILDWIQVTPAFRRKGLGKFVVCELLSRMRNKADFVTVSGKLNDPTNPYHLYISCGFTHPVIWHVVSKPPLTTIIQKQPE